MRIVEYPHPALKHPAVPVRSIDKDLKLQVGKMFELMYDAKGLGLAATQVALPYQLLVMNMSGNPDESEREQVFLNPRVVRQKGNVLGDEGCLSFPGMFAKVRRAKHVVVEAYDLQGKKHTIEASDLDARCWQHEIDHLEGKMFIDRFSVVAKLTTQSDLKAFEKKFRRAQESGELPPDADIAKLLHELENKMTAG